MNPQIDKVIKTYRTLANIPAVVSARIIANGTIVYSNWSQRNLEKNKATKYSRTHLLTSDLKTVTDIVPSDTSNELLSSFSPSENFRAVIKSGEGEAGTKQFLEIWSRFGLIQTVDLTALELHGDVYTGSDLATLQWSSDENKLLYVAEKKETKSEPFCKRKPVKQEDTKSSEATKGEQYLFKQDWGEQLVGKHQSVIVQYDIQSESFKIVEGVPEGLFPISPIWAPDNSYIVGVALRVLPRKLGLIYCTNRPSAIFTLDFNENYDEISPEGKSVKHPTFTLDGKTLVWLQRDAGGPHHACMQLVKREVPLKKLKQSPVSIVDVVQSEITIVGERKFYGLYNSGFVKRHWATGRRLVLSTNQRNTINTYVIDIDSGKITELEYDDGSQIVLDVCNDMILVNRRNYLMPDKLAVGYLPTKGNENTITFKEITGSEKIENFDTLIYNYIDLKYSSPSEVDSFTAIYVGPKTGKEKDVPLILWPHGGPHSAFANNLTLECSLFLSLGFAVLFVNYRGSVGAGQKSVDFLLGKAGTSDVEDCVFAVQQTLKQYPWLNPNRVALVGGSHGGFLVTHLSGQYPDMFKAVVARNPVIDIASLSTTSDIPDWSFVECGSSYSQVGPPNEEILISMRKASPIQHAHKVKAPTLLQVGSKDLRVPPEQATEYYHRLKANGVTARMNLYDDNHPLGTVQNETDNVINTALWILQHLEISF